jgi:hypothetical protein
MKSKLLQIIILFFALNVNAQTTVENFAYGTITSTSADSLTNPFFGGNTSFGSQRWRRHSGSGNPIIYSGSSLAYSGYTSTGIGGSARFAFVSTSAEDAHRNTLTYSSGSVYVSFLLKITASGGTTGDYFFHVMDTAFLTSFRGRMYIKDGSVANTFKIGLNKGSSAAPAYSSANYPLDSTVLVVLKYKFDLTTTANDSMVAYIFTSGVPSTEPSTATLVVPDFTTADLLLFNSVAIRQGTIGTMAGSIDGIRVSNTWSNGVLPVKFLDLNASINDKKTLISWSTSSEINNNGFEIERSIDGYNFETIGFVKGMGNSNKINNYSFEYASTESAFYRLKQIDFDGAYEYSNIVSTKNGINEFEILPNPFKDEITISNTDKIKSIEIIDLTGKVVFSSHPVNNKESINTTNLKSGVYYIKVYSNESVITKKIIKSN